MGTNASEDVLRHVLFPLGQIYITPGALVALIFNHTDAYRLLYRHCLGDFGDLCEEDKRLNMEALKEGTRVLSAYTLAGGERLYVITEADRRSTTLLLVDEY